MDSQNPRSATSGQATLPRLERQSSSGFSLARQAAGFGSLPVPVLRAALAAARSRGHAAMLVATLISLAPDGFVGTDHLAFTASSGMSTSRPAEFEIVVTSGPEDTSPPRIVWSSPENNAEVERAAATESFSDASGPVFAPILLIEFSDPIDDASLTTEHVTPTGPNAQPVAIGVSFDAFTRRLSVASREPWRLGIYEVTISGIRDRFGNAMPTPHAWRFNVVSLLGETPPSGCAGDCNADGEVTIDELIKGVNIALEMMPLSACASFDKNDDGAVTIDELIGAVNNALRGCETVPPTGTPPVATRTGTPTATWTRAPSPTTTQTLIPTVTTTATRTPTQTSTGSATPTATHTLTLATASATLTRTPVPSPSPTPSATATRTPSATATVTPTTAPPTTPSAGGRVEEATAGGAIAIANGMGVLPSVVAAIASGFQYGSGALVFGADNAAAAASCPQGGSASRTGNIGGTVNISLSNCRLATTEGLLEISGSVVLTGLFPVSASINVQATLFDDMGSIIRQIASAVLTGTITPQLGGVCSVNGGTFQISSGTLSNEIPGAATFTLTLANTNVGVAVTDFSTDCVPLQYSLTFNGPATVAVTVAAAARAAATWSFDLTFGNFVLRQDARTAPPRTELNGNITAVCFGGTMNLITRTPLTQPAGTACPNGGVLRLSAVTTSDLFYLSDGAVGIDTNLDGATDLSYRSCLDTALHTCVEPVATATLTRTPTRSVTASPTHSPSSTRTVPPGVTATPPPTPTATATPSRTPTAPATLSRTPTATATRSASPTSAARLYCDTLGSPLPIPDDDENGTVNQITIADDRSISGLRVHLQIDHTWVGDLVVMLAHVDTLAAATLMQRPGEGDFGCDGDNVDCVFDDAAEVFADNQCADPPPAIAGKVRPSEPLSVFRGESSAGDWILIVSDRASEDTGTLVHWCLEVL